MRETVRTSFCAALAAIITSLLLVACSGDAVGVDGNNANQNVNQNTDSVLCGNGVVDACEVCDDGNNTSGDGCSADCHWDPVVLASGQDRPWDIAVDATHVYWTNGHWPIVEPGTVMKVPLGGGAPTALTSGQEQPAYIAVSLTHVYWTIGLHPYGLMQTPLAGGATTEVAPWVDGSIAVDATFIYYQQGLGMGLMKMDFVGGEAIQLASTGGIVKDMVVDSTHVHWTSFESEGFQAHLYQVPVADGTRVALVSGQERPTAVAVDSTHVYWTDGSHGTVTKMPLAGGTHTALVSGQDGPYEIEVDTTHVYFSATDVIMKVPLAGGCRTTLVSGQGDAVRMATDATHVYWTNRAAGTVMKVRK